MSEVVSAIVASLGGILIGLTLNVPVLLWLNARDSRRYRERRIAEMLASGDPKYDWMRRSGWLQGKSEP